MPIYDFESGFDVEHPVKKLEKPDAIASEKKNWFSQCNETLSESNEREEEKRVEQEAMNCKRGLISQECREFYCRSIRDSLLSFLLNLSKAHERKEKLSSLNG